MKSVINLSLLVVLIATALGLTSCKKDGVYNPTEKIKAIYSTTYGGQKVLNQTWNWDKNKLMSVYYYDGGSSMVGYLKYVYDGKRLIKTTDSDGWNTKVSYDGCKIEKVEYFSPKGRIYVTFLFDHDDSKVSEVECYEYEYDDDNIFDTQQKLKFMSKFIPQQVVEKVTTTDRSSMSGRFKSDGLAAVYYWDADLEYDGKNLSSVEIKYYDLVEDSPNVVLEVLQNKINISFDGYDNKSNPFYRNFADVYGTFGDAYGYEYSGIASFSKNNPLNMHVRFMTMEDGYANEYYSITALYEYQYDGKFPTVVTTKGVDSEDSYQYTTYYEYEK